MESTTEIFFLTVLGARSPRSGRQEGEVLVRILSSQVGFSVHPHTGWGVGKREREEKTQRHRENSLMFHFMKTLNLSDQCSTLRAQLMLMGFSGGSDGKESALNVRDLGSIPGSGRFPGEGNGKPLQYSCLSNPMDRGVWWAIDHGIPKSQNPSQNTALWH